MKWCLMAATTLAVLSFSTGLEAAKAAERTSEALLTCANESDDAQRLRCFDAVVAGLRKGQPAPAAPAETGETLPAAATSAAAPQAAASGPTPQERFGARGDIHPEKREQLNQLTATVTALGTKPHGELIVTLDNGQVWGEITGSKVKLKTGDTVKIERGALGSYTLVAPNGRSSKVSRMH